MFEINSLRHVVPLIIPIGVLCFIVGLVSALQYKKIDIGFSVMFGSLAAIVLTFILIYAVPLIFR